MAKILIVEDDEITLGMYKTKLENEKYVVCVAGNGREGLVKAKAEKPDLILLDIRMPVMNGMEMLKELRRDVWGKSVPVIILTNFDSDDQLTWEITKTQPSYYLLKAGNRPSAVLEKIKETLVSNNDSTN